MEMESWWITLDREEFLTKIEVINQFVHNKDYKSALEVVESIEWKKVKSARTLCVAGEVYAANRCYQESKEIFLMAYKRSPVRKNILYRLIEVSIKMEDLEDALKYYQEFLEMAPNDNIHYILKYKLYSARKTPLEDQIQILEEYKEREYTERWSYELAKLYYKAGDVQKCIEACDDLVLWFSEGEYVLKALELKMRLADLTPRQQKIYEQELYEKEQGETAQPEQKPDGAETETGQKREDEESEDAAGAENEAAGQGQEEPIEAKEPEKLGIEEPLSMEDYTDEVPKKPKINDEIVPIMESNGSLQEKITKGIKDIFAGIVKGEWEEDEDFLESYAIEPKISIADVIPPQTVEENIKEMEEKEHQPEMSPVEMEEVPVLQDGESEVVEGLDEQEDLVAAQPESQEETWHTTHLRIENAEKFDTSKLPKLEMPDFNLEEVILSAAEKQGIDVSDREDEGISTASEEKQEEYPQEPSEHVDKDTENTEDVEEQPAEAEIFRKIQPEGEVHPQEDPVSEEESLIEFIDSQNQRDEEDPDMIIPRDKNLDEVEQKLFSYFSTIPGMSEQLVEALADAQMSASDKTSRSGNIIVMGNLRTGKTRLTEGLIRSICRELHMPAAKKATVEASQLNGKDIPKIVSKMSGGFLVIQKTNQLSPESVDQLNQSMEFRTDGLTVILEDEKIGMRKFIAKYPKFTKKFTSTINIPVFTNDELVHFAKVYADEMGYVMDTMGVLALYNLIGDNQKEDEPMTIGAVKDMMDEAITKAESSHRKLQRSISKKRFDSEGKIVLYEKDFK